MSERPITPRSAAFQREEHAAHAASEVNALATHNDPSLAKSKNGQRKPGAADRTRIEWVHPSEVGERLTAGGMSRAADAHMRLHAHLRKRMARKPRQPGEEQKKLPDSSNFGRSASKRRTTARTTIG